MSPPCHSKASSSSSSSSWVPLSFAFLSIPTKQSFTHTISLNAFFSSLFGNPPGPTALDTPLILLWHPIPPIYLLGCLQTKMPLMLYSSPPRHPLLLDLSISVPKDHALPICIPSSLSFILVQSSRSYYIAHLYISLSYIPLAYTIPGSCCFFSDGLMTVLCAEPAPPVCHPTFSSFLFLHSLHQVPHANKGK